MAKAPEPDPDLSPAQQILLETLRASERPLTAYQLMHMLRTEGFKTPAHVYRALKALTARGLIHRIEMMSGYVAARRATAGADAQRLFAICERCGAAFQMASTPVVQHIETAARKADFAIGQTSIELTGLCETCRGEHQTGSKELP